LGRTGGPEEVAQARPVSFVRSRSAFWRNSLNQIGPYHNQRLYEKGGKEHEMPVHHLLEQILNQYIAAAGLQNGEPLFQSVNSLERQ
jgi:hypothetical protein